MSIDMVCSRLPASRWRKNCRCARGPKGAKGDYGCVRIPGDRALIVTIADIEAARRVIQGAVLRTPMLPAPRLSALTGAEVYVKYENLQVTNSFKDRGALVKLASLERGRAQARRHRHVGRQSRAGAGLSRRAAQDSGDHRDAGDHAVREGGGDPLAWRRGGARRRDRGGGASALRTDASRARSHAGASLRRRPHHRRAGHHRARNAGGGRRSRCAGDPDRRRRADRRQRHRRAREKSEDRDRRRRSRALPLGVECAA